MLSYWIERRPNVLMYISGIFDEEGTYVYPNHRGYNHYSLELWPATRLGEFPLVETQAQLTDYHLVMLLHEDNLK